MSDRADRFTAVLDTNVLVGALTRNMILSLAEVGIFRPRWSRQTIAVEFIRVFDRLYPDKDGVGDRQRRNIEKAFPEATAHVSPGLMNSLSLPDADDLHILAAAIMTKAAVIVTDNLKDFPKETLAAYEIEAISADDFLADCIDLGKAEALAALRTMRERFKNPAMDAESLLTRMEQLGLVQTAKMLAPWKAVL